MQDTVTGQDEILGLFKSVAHYINSRRICAEELARAKRSRQSLNDFLADALAEELESPSLALARENPASSPHQ